MMVPDIKKNVISNTVVNVDYTRIESESSISIGLGDDDNGNGNDDDDDDDDDDGDEYEVDMISITDSRHNSNINVNHPFFDSFVSVGVSLMLDDDDDDDDDDDLDDPNDDDDKNHSDDDDHSSKSTPSMKSIGDISSNINIDENDNDNDNNDNDSTTTPGRTFKERIVRYVFFGLLVLMVIFLVVIVATTATSTTTNGRSSSSITITVTVAIMILILIGGIGITFLSYEKLLKSREQMLVKSNRRSEAIVDSLFPSIVRDRILEEGGLVNTTNTNTKRNVKNVNVSVNNSGSNDDDPVNSNNSENHLPSSSLPPNPPTPPPPRSPSPPLSSVVSSSQHILSSPLFKMKKNFSNSNKRDSISTVSSHQSTIPRNPPPVSSSSTSSSKPIADYFPSASILFADIVGFTSWASIRDPAQVFILLETVYGRFDDIAKKKGVFKVETIGDCYVAATGLPTPRTDHAIVMASFARRCLENMLDLLESRELENELGMGTNDLGMRFGIHSGSVIGGVLRGAKSRYQLFGDTINTASRIESSSMKNKIHLSEQTAELLIAGGKMSWVEEREEKIHAKGKGELQTYWLTTEGPNNLSAKEQLALPALLKMMKKANIDPTFCATKRKTVSPEEKKERLVDYHTHMLTKVLKKLLMMRRRNMVSTNTVSTTTTIVAVTGTSNEMNVHDFSTNTISNEVLEDINFPTATTSIIEDNTTVRDVKSSVDTVVLAQLRELVSRTAGLYQEKDRPFHSFEHASHAVLSVIKLLAAIERKLNESSHSRRGSLNDSSHSRRGSGQHQGNSSGVVVGFDSQVVKKTKLMITHPLTQFVLIYATLVCDVGRGCDVTQANKSNSKQDSIERAWSLLMEPSFRDLREFICGKEQEQMVFFRRLLVKSIMATDVNDSRDVVAPLLLRRSSTQGSLTGEDQKASQKAMGIIEKLVQASDGSHALQHFSVFTKWNKLLFKEKYLAYESGRATTADKDPSEIWYERELKFFDSRIVLAKQLQNCRVFNKVAEIYVNAALSNRREWEKTGRSIVKDYLSTYEGKSAVSDATL